MVMAQVRYKNKHSNIILSLKFANMFFGRNKAFQSMQFCTSTWPAWNKSKAPSTYTIRASGPGPCYLPTHSEYAPLVPSLLTIKPCFQCKYLLHVSDSYNAKKEITSNLLPSDLRIEQYVEMWARNVRNECQHQQH
jgi:hypothetical protein